MHHRLIALLIAVATALASLAQTALAAPDRVALVIGNGAYVNAGKLANPTNDAADVAVALRKLGFDVVEGRDLDKRGMEAKIIEFSRKLDRAGVALFFYAGHGMQVGGRNHLVPIDARLERAGDLSFETLDVSQVLAQMEAEKRVNLVFLDACRDNPLARSFSRALGTRSAVVGNGLASIQGAVGTMIVYATQPDNVALDGDGTRNSPFTTALLKHIATPGLEIRTMITRVRADVLTATREKQVPWDHSSLTSEVTLTPALPLAVIPAPAPAPSITSDEIAWSFLKDTSDASQLRRFVEQYPSSARRNDAAARLLTLEQQKVAALPPAPSAPTPPTGGFSRVSTFDLGVVYTSGDDNISIDRKIASAESCRDLCLVTPSCALWQFGQVNRPTACVLSRSVGYITSTRSPDYTSGRISEQPRAGPATSTAPVAAPPPIAPPPEPVRTSAITRGIALGGSGVISSSVTASVAECRDVCIKEKKCNAWSYFSPSYIAVVDGGSTNDELRKKCLLYEKGALGRGEVSRELFNGVVKTVTPAAAPAALPEPLRTSAIVVNRRLTNFSDTIATATLPSAAECRDKCVKEKRCNAWYYHPASYPSAPGFQKMCLILEKGTIGTNEEKSGISSGVVTSGKAAASNR